MCLCGADPCVCETARQQAEWAIHEKRLALMAYWQECADAAENQRVKRSVYMPPPCDFPEDE